jgi:RNA polymerase sigma-70 factor (ECF subfamily)
MDIYSAYTDQELVALLKRGDARSLTEIHARYNTVLYTHAYKRYPCREEIRDILQELFIYLWDNRQDLVFNTGLAAYLYAAIRNRLLSLYRKQKTRGDYIASLQGFIDKGENHTEDYYQEKELLEIINREIAALPQQMRLVFELSRNQELTHNEIAEQLNLSPHTVRTQVRSALRILRLKLGANIFLMFF